MDDVGTIVGGRFELEAMAGRGGMGTVYRARDRVTGNKTAVKILRDGTTSEHRDRFIREAQVMAELTHPAFVRCLNWGADGDRPFLAMEWLEGVDLQQRLQHGGLTADESIRLIVRVAAALGAAHARGIIHRDIKPSNLFLVGGDVDRTKVLDFGIAHVRREGLSEMTRTGAAIGTPRYMAPEQARGSRDVDARCDVFSLGCVLFECLVGHPPFTGDNPIAVLMKILLEEAPRIGALRDGSPAALDDLVARMISKDPAVRPRDGLAVAFELDAIGPIESLGATASRERDSAVSVGEQRLVSVVVATTVVDGPSSPPLETAPTMASEPGADDAAETSAIEKLTKQVSHTVAGHRGRSAVLPDGTIAVTFAGQGSAIDQAAKAARCALAIRELMPGSTMALAIGRSSNIDRAVGDLIDRATGMLRVPTKKVRGARPIRVDEVAAGLLDVRFAIHGDEAGLVLARERDVSDDRRTLLGKPTKCVGRERELGSLQAMYAECVNEPKSQIVLVTAPAGVGKSRLRHELVQRVTNQAELQPEIWIARGDSMSAGAPFAMLAQLLRRAAGIADDEPLSIRQRKLKARVLRNVTDDAQRVVEFLGELVGAPSREEPSVQLRAARQDPQLMGDQMLRAWEDFVAAESSVGPIMIMLEDLHWGDVPTVRAIDTVIRQLPERPVYVLAFARPEIESVFPRLWHERSVERIQLGELTRRAAEKMIRDALATVDEATVTRLVDRAAGNAFYLEELIRSVAEGHGDRLPETVVAMAQARIEALEPAARHVLRAASIFGMTFWPGGLSALLDDNIEVAGWIDQLVERELVIQVRESRLHDQTEYRFRHSLVREAAYAMLTDRDRTRGHFQAGEWLDVRFHVGEALERAASIEPVVLAEHFERGGDPRRASGWYQRAAEQALEGDDLAAAIDRAERAITSLRVEDASSTAEDRERAGVLRQLQSDAHIWRGEYPLSAARGKEALGLLAPASTHWLNAAATVADAWCRQLVHGDVIALCKQLVEIPVTPALHGAYAHAVAMTMPTVLWHTDSDLDVALHARLDEVAAALDPDDPIALGWVCCARSWRALRDGDLGMCHALDSKIVECFTLVGDLRHACQQRAYVGYDELILGAFAQAEISLREAIGIAERMGLLQVTAQAQHNLGLVLARLGRLDEAREVETAALRALDAQGNRRLALTARNYLGLIEIDAGNYARAIEYATEAVATGGDMETALSPYLATASTACRLAGDPAGALAHAKHALDLIAIHGQPEEGEALIRLAHAHALYANGMHAEAIAVITEAEAAVLAKAAKIQDERWRASFLEAIPENAETLALARAWREGAARAG